MHSSTPLRPHPELLVFAANPRGLAVRTVKSNFSRQLPPHITEDSVFKAALAQFEAKCQAQGWFDGETVPVVDVTVSSDEVVLHCTRGRYSQGFALTAWAKGQFEQGLEPAIFPIVNAPAANCGLDVALICADGRVFLNQRSTKLAKFPGHWMLGFGEGLESCDLEAPDFSSACVRCLHEELALPTDLMTRPGVQFRAVAVVREAVSGTWNAYCIVDLRQADETLFNHVAVLKGMTAAKDKWESSALLPLAPELIPEFLSSVESTPGARCFGTLLLDYLTP